MFWIWKASLAWFGNLRLRTKLYISFGWMCLFTVVLGVVCLGGIHRVRVEVAGHPGAVAAATENPPAESQSVEARTVAIASQFQSVILLLLGGIIVADILMAWRLVHLIGDPVLHACEVLDRISNRDLSIEAKVESEDEVGQMCAALNRTIHMLHDVLGQLGESSEGLEKAALDLNNQTICAQGNCHQQVDLAREVLTSTRLLAEKGSKIAHNTIEAAQASRESSQVAHGGNTAMSSAAETMNQVAAASATIHELMNRLDARSREIGKVVTTIREISENTNLLALNASIEAARAGEHGRGFAVVAGEVRRLAEHTRQATEEIATTVESILEETANTTRAVESSRSSIEAGQQRTAEAHRMLSEIIRHANRTETLADDASTAAGEQSAAGEQIASNAGRVAELAEASLTASGEVARTGEGIRDSARQLGKVVRQFRL
jgi:methyl-accepting chemotaxis protein